MTADWQILPRERDLSRVYDPLGGWEKLVLIERDHQPSTWTVTARSEHLADAAEAGKGSILFNNGQQITSGRLTRIQRGTAYNSEVEDVVDMTTLSFADDRLPLGGRLVFPSPGHNLTPEISNFPAAYDLRTGTVEDLIIGYIRSHAGDMAQADRQIPRLRMPAVSQGRGGTTQVSGRLDVLGTLVGSLADAGNLKVSIVHTEDSGGAWLDLRIDSVTDRSADIRFGSAESTAAGIVNEWNYDIAIPTTTRAVVAGGGELTARDFLQLDAPDQEALWAIVMEMLIDQRHVAPETENKLSELTRAAKEGLEQGAGPTSVSFVPVLGQDVVYRRDVFIGDIVGYDLPGLPPSKDKIRQATTTVTVGDEGEEFVELVVGTPDAPTTRSQQQTARALREINILKRSN